MIIALKGGAEAEAMRKKADSFKEYNEVAFLQILLAALPEIAKAVADLARLVGGEFAVESVPEKGTVIRVTVPLRDGSE